jgi:2-polyprenyl-3-methyl-5-hydroxy-6-metoxy-1,4-benzoquinol methylase
MTESPDWKAAFYDAYVSTGQAGSNSGLTAAEFFGPRMAYLKHLVVAHIPSGRDQRIVDLGCGAGAMLFVLDRAGYRNLAGVDVSQEQIDIAHSLGISSAECARLEDFLALQPASSVDVVFAIDILEHLTRPELMSVLNSIRPILRPGGRCIAHVPNAEGLYSMAIRYGDATHELAFTRSSASQIFRAAGFAQVVCFEDRPRVHGLKSFVRRLIWDLGTLPGRILRIAESGSSGAILSQNMVIEARVGSPGAAAV